MAHIKNIDNLVNLINCFYNRKMHKRLSVFLLQDLLYISQGICLTVYNQPFFDDDIVAQTHGSHVASVDWKFRDISHLHNTKHLNECSNSIFSAFHNHDYDNPKYRIGKILDTMFSYPNYYKSNDRVLGLFLSRKGTPYNTVMNHIAKTRETNPFEDDYPDLYTVIPKNLIKQYFAKNIVMVKQ